MSKPKYCGRICCLPQTPFVDPDAPKFCNPDCGNCNPKPASRPVTIDDISKAVEFLKNVGNEELNQAAFEQLGMYQRYFSKCVYFIQDVATQRIDGCLTATAVKARDLLLELGVRDYDKPPNCS